jgi:hypothetical protein
MNAANTAQTPFGGHIAGTIGPGDDGHPDKNYDNSRGSLADRAHLSKNGAPLLKCTINGASGGGAFGFLQIPQPAAVALPHVIQCH